MVTIFSVPQQCSSPRCIFLVQFSHFSASLGMVYQQSSEMQCCGRRSYYYIDQRTEKMRITIAPFSNCSLPLILFLRVIKKRKVKGSAPARPSFAQDRETLTFLFSLLCPGHGLAKPISSSIDCCQRCLHAPYSITSLTDQIRRIHRGESKPTKLSLH